jgi:polyketide cyclase/dehydrase/lipid transport protein
MSTTYAYTHTVEAHVTAEAIWSLYEDVETWPSWDAQAERITRDGPFATGSTGTMKFRDQGPLPYRLTKVEPRREFVDETPVGDIVVRVAHLLEPLSSGQLRITYAAEIDGPKQQTERIGPAITADFPATIDSLIALAKQRSA